MAGCDGSTLYHADCIRELYLGRSSLSAPKARGFKCEHRHSEKTRTLANCVLVGLRGCVHGVNNTDKPRTTESGVQNAFTDCARRQRRGAPEPHAPLQAAAG